MAFKLKATGSFEIQTLDTKKITKTLREQIEIQSRQAARAWLRAVIARIPTYTGTARGTFKPLGRVLRVAVNKGFISEAASKKKVFRYKGRSYPLGFEAGANYSKFDFILEDSRDTLSVVFKYELTLPYLLWNDIYPAPAWITLPSNPPWAALQAGDDAWQNYIENELPKRKRITNLNQFIKVETKRISNA